MGTGKAAGAFLGAVEALDRAALAARRDGGPDDETVTAALSLVDENSTTSRFLPPSLPVGSAETILARSALSAAHAGKYKPIVI